MGLDHRPDLLLPIGLIGAVDLRRDLQRHSSSDSNLDGAVGAFFRRNPTEESKITAGCVRLERKKVAWEPVMNGTDPIHVPQVVPLVVRDRDQRQFSKGS